MGPVWPPTVVLFPPTARPSASPTLALCPNSALRMPRYMPCSQAQAKPCPRLPPAHEHPHVWTHQEVYTPPTLHAHTNTQTNGRVSTPDVCTHRLYIQARDTYPEAHPTQAHSPTHPPKTATSSHIQTPHRQITHTSLVRALSPQGSGSQAIISCYFLSCRSEQSGRWRGWGQGWAILEEVTDEYPTSPGNSHTLRACSPHRPSP